MNLNDVAKNGIFCDGDWIEKKDQDPNGDVRLIQLADIGDGFFKDVSNRYITSEKAKELNCTYLEKGDILIARLPEPLGRACIFPLEGKYITAVDIAVVRVVRDDIEPKYLMNLINSVGFRAEIKKYESGTTRKRISRKNLGKIEFSIPDIGEQRKTIEKLEETMSSLDNAVETLNKTKEQLGVYRQAVLSEAFKADCTWNNCKLGDVITVLTDYHSNGSYQVLKENVTLLDDPSYAVMVRSTNFEKKDFIFDLKYIDEHAYHFLKKSQLFGGEVLMGKIGNAGRVYYMKNLHRPMSLAMNMFAMRFSEEVESKYVYYFLKSPEATADIEQYIKGVGTPTIDKKSVRSILFRYPDRIKQNEIINSIESRLSLCDGILDTVELTFSQAEAMRQSILKKAFEGEL